MRHVVATCEPTPIVTKCGDEGWSYIGVDDRGLELEAHAPTIRVTMKGLSFLHWLHGSTDDFADLIDSDEAAAA